MWYVYICDKKGKLFTGITIKAPGEMTGEKARLLHYEKFEGKHDAMKREREIRSLSRDKKLALIADAGA